MSPQDQVAITPLGYDLGSVAVKIAAFVPGLVPVVKNRTNPFAPPAQRSLTGPVPAAEANAIDGALDAIAKPCPMLTPSSRTFRLSCPPDPSTSSAVVPDPVPVPTTVSGACGAFVIHAEVDDFAVGLDAYRLAVLPAHIDHRAGAREQVGSAAAMATEFRHLPVAE